MLYFCVIVLLVDLLNLNARNMDCEERKSLMTYYIEHVVVVIYRKF